MNPSKKKYSGRSFRPLMVVAAILVALALPVSASAQVAVGPGNCGPTDSQYAPPAGSINCQDITASGGGGTNTASTTSSSSSLPFTGMDIVPLVAIAAALGAAGLMLRRLGSEETDRV